MKFKAHVNATDTDMTSAVNYQHTLTDNNQEITMLSDPNYWLHDMEYLYLRSFNELESVFRSKQFRESKAYKDMLIELNSNMVEYKFLHKAGILKAN